MIVFDIVINGPATLLHESASSPAVGRIRTPDGHDLRVTREQRAHLSYDAWEMRHIVRCVVRPYNRFRFAP